MTAMGRKPTLSQLAHLQPILLRPRLDRLLAAGQRLADRLQAHALAGEPVELLDLVAGPRLFVALEFLGHAFLRIGRIGSHKATKSQSFESNRMALLWLGGFVRTFLVPA